jgi:Cu-processing system ATP-binding protein
MKSIVGLIRPDSGSIVVDGVRVNGDERYRAAIGYMPQIARFPENLTAAELFAMLRDLRGLDVQVDESLVRAFNLEPHLHKPLRVLSGGTRQKVNAAMAFLFRPKVLVLDEPTAGLDPLSSAILKDAIIERRALGAAVLVTSHIMSELEELCDDVAFLLDGVIRFVGPVKELTTITRQANLERAVASLMIREVA